MSHHQAAFYAPSSPSAQPARVSFEGDSVVIEIDQAPGAEPMRWPRAALQFEEGAVAGGPIRVTSPSGPGLLMVSDPALLALFGRRQKSGATALGQGLAIFLAVTVALILAGYFLFLPWIAGVLARSVPASVEQQIGRAAIEQLAPVAQRCEDEAVRKPVRTIVDKLGRRAPNMGYAFQVYIVKDKMVNALATPGGYIVVYTGLLEKTKSPEELAAVLAHEMTHITGRHSTVGIMRAMTFWIMLSYLIGDPSGMLVQAAGALSQLSYQRGQEEEADLGAMKLFEQARVDPRGLEQAFTMLSKETPEIPASARYFSTHPRTEDRLAEIRKWRATASYRPEPLLDVGTPWPPRGDCMTGK
jgi:beta-barrel assembly-enhancing protease